MTLRPPPPVRVPTLTEVVSLPEAPASTAAFARTEPAPLEPAPASASVPAAPASHEWDEEELVQRVLSDLQRQIDLMLEIRLREVLAPALTRATDALMREARTELASTLRDVVSRAVAQEIARHRGR